MGNKVKMLDSYDIEGVMTGASKLDVNRFIECFRNNERFYNKETKEINKVDIFQYDKNLERKLVKTLTK